MRTCTSAAAYAPRTPRHPATCGVSASKCGSPSTVYTLVSPDPPVCKTEIHAYDMALGSSSHCCDAGAGSCTGDGAGAAGSVPVTTAFEAVLYPLAPAVEVADAGAVAANFPGMVSGTACGYAAAAAAWEPGRGSGHQHLSPPCTAGFGYSPIACDLACPPTLIVTLRNVPLCFHPSRLGTLGCVVFVSSTALQLGPRSSHRSRVTSLCRLLACSILGLSHRLVPSLLVYDVEQCVGVMHLSLIHI